MILLAFDTSAPLGAVAVGRLDDGLPGGPVVLARRFLHRQGAHGSALIPSVDSVLDEAGLERSSLDGVVVGGGPGSFTGLRVAAATAKGLVRALDLPLFAASSLAAGAATAGMDLPELEAPVVEFRDSHRPRYILFDARGTRIYGACYRILDKGVETLTPPHGGTVDDVLSSAPPSDTLFLGSGARRHAGLIHRAGFPVLPEPGGDPTADGLLRIIAGELERHRVEDVPHWEPTYLREWKPGWEREAG